MTFDCPLCGIHATDVDLTIEIEQVESHHPIAMWPGGPLVVDTSAPTEVRWVNTWISTTACQDRFSVWLWDLNLIEQSGSRIIRLTPKDTS